MIEDIDYPSQETLDAWPDCPVAGCLNKCCLRLESAFCHPHTKGSKSLDELEETLNDMGFKLPA